MMGLTIEQLLPIKEEFEQKYFFSPPYDEYVNGCGISKLRIIQDIRKKNIDLQDGESLDDLCLSVYVREEPPKELEFPSEYKKVKVFYEIIGEIRPL